MGGSGGGGGKTTSVQDIPPEFKPAFTALFNSTFGAGRQAAGQGMYSAPPPTYPPLPNLTPMEAWGGWPQGGQFSSAQMMGAPAQGQAFTQPQQMYQAGGGFNQPPPAQVQQQGGVFKPDDDVKDQRTGRGGGPVGAGFPGGPQIDWAGGSVQPWQPITKGGKAAAPGTEMPLVAGPPIVGQAFPGPFTAATNPLEQQALAQRQMIGQQLQGAGTPLLNLGMATASGAFLNPQTNPYLNTAINYALQPAVEQFTGSTLPAFESQALQSGAFKGSSARDMAIANMTNQFGRNLLGTAGAIGYGDYANERMLQQQAGQMIDQAARIQQLGPEILSQAGLGQRELQQRLLNERLLQFQEMQQAPYRPLGPLASIIQGSDIGATGFSRISGGPQPSALGGGIAGALGGAGLGANIGSMFNQGGSMAGTGYGAGAGGLLGMLAGALG